MDECCGKTKPLSMNYRRTKKTSSKAKLENCTENKKKSCLYEQREKVLPAMERNKKAKLANGAKKLKKSRIHE